MTLLQLPNELLMLTIGYLDGKDIRTLILTCARLKGQLLLYLYQFDSKRGCRALFWAAQSKDYEIALEVMGKSLKAGANPISRDFSNYTPLDRAVRNCSVSIVQRLLQCPEVKEVVRHTDDGDLLICTDLGSDPLKLPGNLDSRDYYWRVLGLPPYRSQQRDEILRLLLDAGANPNPNFTDSDLESEHTQTPLWRAADNGYHRAVQLLLLAKAEVNSVDDTPPFQRAAWWGYEEIVKLLLEAGADTDSQNHYAPLTAAAERGDETMVKLLLNAGARWNESRDWQLYTSLELAAGFGHEQIVKLLLKKAKDEPTESRRPADDTRTYRRALYFAEKFKYNTIQNLLLQEGLEVWRTYNKIDLDISKRDIQSFRSRIPVHGTLEDIIQRLRSASLARTILELDFYTLNMDKLTRYQMLPYAYGTYNEEIRKTRRSGKRVIRSRPYVCLILSVADNPTKLVKELQKVQNIGVYLATVQGEIVAGDWKEPIIVEKSFYERDGKETQVSPRKTLSPWKAAEPLDSVNVMDVYVHEWDVNVNLADIIEQAARNCRYFGRFAYQDGSLIVERADPSDPPWDLAEF